MRKPEEQSLEQTEINQYAYHRLLKAQTIVTSLFKHDDQSISKILAFKNEGYINLCVLPDKSQSNPVSADQRRAMFQNRPKKPLNTPNPRPEWTITETQQKMLAPPTKEAGWKFHISIAQDPGNLEDAWSALVPILLKYKIGQTKIVNSENQQVANKVITVYTFNGGPKIDDWGPFLKDVELAFIKCGVKASEQIYEYHVTGSNYIYYRNDAGHNGEYIKDEYHLLYRVADQIPLSAAQLSKLARELQETQNAVGCVIKVRDSEDCCLHLYFDNKLTTKEFNVNLLETLENPNQHQLITVSPLTNRDAYIDLVVPQLGKAIPSTNNVTKQDDPFRNIDHTLLMHESTSQSMTPAMK